jgi:hypothetical protein
VPFEYPQHQQVVVHDLNSAKGQKHNGRTGRVLEAAGGAGGGGTLDRVSGRYTVKLDLTDELLRVKPANLRKPTASDYEDSANLAMNNLSSGGGVAIASSSPTRAAAEALARKAVVQGQHSCVVPGRPMPDIVSNMLTSAEESCATDPTYCKCCRCRCRCRRRRRRR